MRVEGIVERIWPGREARIEVLGGGSTNHNFKVELGRDTYVLRVGGRDTELLGIDRRAEHEASLAAAAVGVGPEVVSFIEPEGYLVTRFIEGTIVPVETIRAPEAIARVATSLRAVHAGPPIPSRFDSFRVVEAYRATAATHGIATPPGYEEAKRVADRIERARGAVPERPCHNDLLNANFIDDGRLIRIVDWEYAGMGDVFFDLANFAINHELSEEEGRLLLEAYFGRVRPEHEGALRLMRFMSDFREAMWGVVQQAVSDLDFDFADYADRHFERLSRTAAEPGFRAALGWAKPSR
jgi:thiamine kinase-like enzyme